MIKKYKLDAFDSLVSAKDGYLVYYDDYLTLEAENARLRKALEEIVATQIYFDGHAVVIAEEALEQNLMPDKDDHTNQ